MKLMKLISYELPSRKGRLFLIVFMTILLSTFTVNTLLGAKAKKPRALIVLIDETDAFGNKMIPKSVLEKEKSSIRNLWELSVSETARYIVDCMGPGEGFLLIGIDTSGWDDDDTRVGPKVLRSDLRYMGQRVELRKTVQNLIIKNQRRSCKGDADIPGALSFAHHYMRNFSKHRIVIVIFSVMSNTSWDLSQISDKKFPEDTEVYCFNAIAQSEEEWTGKVKYWMNVFRTIGISEISEDNFWSVTETLLKLNELFPKR